MGSVTNPIDGTAVAFREVAPERAGSKPPVVMVHGTALSQAIWRGFGYVRAFAHDRPVVTIDVRGHGRSGKPHDANAYRMELVVADVLAVLDTLQIDRAHWLGYSLGGRIGFSVAAQHQDRLVSLTSAGGAPRLEPGSFDRVFFPGTIEALESGGMDAFLEKWEEQPRTRIDASTRAAFNANDALALAAYMREAERDAGVDESALAGVTLPTLLLVGSRDGERLRAAERAHSIMPSSQLRVLEGATHGDTLRHPDALPAIREFIDAADGESAVDGE